VDAVAVAVVVGAALAVSVAVAVSGGGVVADAVAVATVLFAGGALLAHAPAATKLPMATYGPNFLAIIIVSSLLRAGE
jgi:hypothetical protein